MGINKTYFAIIYDKGEADTKIVRIPNNELWECIQKYKEDEERVAIFEADCVLDFS